MVKTVKFEKIHNVKRDKNTFFHLMVKTCILNYNLNSWRNTNTKDITINRRQLLGGIAVNKIVWEKLLFERKILKTNCVTFFLFYLHHIVVVYKFNINYNINLTYLI